MALNEGRRNDTAALVRHLRTEATETHELFLRWAQQIPAILSRAGADVGDAVPGAPQADSTAFELSWREFVKAIDDAAERALAGSLVVETVESAIHIWVEAHDRQLRYVASWLAVAVDYLGERSLGALWAELQADGISEYGRYALSHQPWDVSFAQLTQIAIEGMHAHYGGPERIGEVLVTEHADRVELSFAPCGSGGQLVDAELFGTTKERYPFAWNKIGVCHYCVHCCVLQQLEPIRNLGYPGRVIDPPLAPGDQCRWTIYRDLQSVPERAYTDVGEAPPSPGGLE